MSYLHEQLKKLRKTLDLTQEEFANCLSVSRSTVATYEVGKSNPSDAAISLICREFNVNEDWLRNGIGDMFLPTDQNTDIAKLTKQLSNEEKDSFKNRVVSMLANLPIEEWEFLEKRTKELCEGNIARKKIEIQTDLPECLDEDFIRVLMELNETELNNVKGVAIGLLLGSGRYTPEQVADLSGFKRR